MKLPKLEKSLLAPLKDKVGNEIKYIHHSVFVHKERRFPIMSAVNIKGEAYNAPKRAGNDPWDYSEQIEEIYQIDNRFYSNDENTFDRGHLVRRVDPSWGTSSIAIKADNQTFRWTNCTPQHKKLNQKGGIWFQLEQHVMEHGVINKIADISVFAGPVLDNKDFAFKKQYLGSDLKIPILFWKIIVWKKTDGKLYAVGFMMSQWEWIKNKLKDAEASLLAEHEHLRDDYFENLKFSDHNTYQVSIKTIEKATDIQFNWTNVNFPYKSKALKQIQKAKTLRKVHDFNTVRKTISELKKDKINPTSKDLIKALNNKSSIPKTKQLKLVKRGYGGALRKYELKGIVL